MEEVGSMRWGQFKAAAGRRAGGALEADPDELRQDNRGSSILGQRFGRRRSGSQ